MAGNGEDQYSPSNMEAKAEGAWGATPIMHSWCLLRDQPVSTSGGQDGQWVADSHDNRSRNSTLVNDPDDDSGLELSLGLSLGDRKSFKPKGKEREKESLLDRDVFHDKDQFRGAFGKADGDRRDTGGYTRDGSGEEPFLDGVTIESIKTEQKGNTRVQAFWQEFGRSAPESNEKGLSASQPSQPVPAHHRAIPEDPWRPVEASGAEDFKMISHRFSQALQEKATQPDHQRVPLSAQDEANLINELQNLPPQAMATAAAWARYVAQGAIPLQLLKMFKDGVDPSTRRVVLQPSLSDSLPSSQHREGLPAPAPIVSLQATAVPSTELERSDSDVSPASDRDNQLVTTVQQQELVEQQRKRELQTQKRQEARKKRKALLEGQKQIKKGKKEDERLESSAPQGFNVGRSCSDTPPNQLRRASSIQPTSPPHTTENSNSIVPSPPDSQDAGGASGVTGFRRPGSSSWSNHWEASHQSAGLATYSSNVKTEKVPTDVGAVQRKDEGEQLHDIRRALQREQGRASKDGGRDGENGPAVDSGDESWRESPPDVNSSENVKNDEGPGGRQLSDRQEGSAPIPFGLSNMDIGRNQIDPVWIHKMFEMQMSNFQAAAMMESNRENATKGPSGFNHLWRGGDSTTERHPPSGEAEKGAERARASSQYSSGGSENFVRKDEKNNNGTRGEHKDGETRPGSSGGAEGVARPNSSIPMSNPFPPPGGAMAVGSMAYPPNSSFPLMPGTYPFPMPGQPGATAGGVPFNVPFPFPYLMQFAPAPSNRGDGNQDQRPHPNMLNPFQIALPPGYPPFQMQTPEGSATWPSAVVRPQPTPPQSPPRNAPPKRNQSGMPHEDDNRNSQGGKSNEHAKSRNSSPGQEPPTPSVHLLSRAATMGSGAFNRLRSTGPTNGSLSGSPAPHFGMSRSKTDALALKREGSTGNVTADVGETSQGGGNPQGTPSSAGGSKGSSPLGGSIPHSERSSSWVAADDPVASGAARPGTSGDSGQSDITAAQSSSSIDEEMKRFHATGVWRQSSLPGFEGLVGQEVSSLRPGIAAGQHFGGTGSPPDLPWVTCNGKGPAGRTISGVLYRVDKGQVRIVCACHGRHMTPAEFVQHAGCGEMPNPEKAIVVGQFASPTQQPASAHA